MIATLGPSTHEYEVLVEMLQAGMSCARVDLTVRSLVITRSLTQVSHLGNFDVLIACIGLETRERLRDFVVVWDGLLRFGACSA